jgi:hypothetical protein
MRIAVERSASSSFAREVRAGEVNELDVTICIPAADYCEGGLDAGLHRSSLFLAAGIWCRPLRM